MPLLPLRYADIELPIITPLLLRLLRCHDIAFFMLMPAHTYYDYATPCHCHAVILCFHCFFRFTMDAAFSCQLFRFAAAYFAAAAAS